MTDGTLQLSAIILMEYVLLLSRIALVDVQSFVTLIAETAKSQGVPEGEIWEVVMSQLWNRVSFDHQGLTVACFTDECPHLFLVR